MCSPHFVNRFLTESIFLCDLIVLSGWYEACDTSLQQQQTGKGHNMNSATQASKMIFDNDNFVYLETMEKKTRENISEFSENLFKLYHANTETLSREKLFKLAVAGI